MHEGTVTPCVVRLNRPQRLFVRLLLLGEMVTRERIETNIACSTISPYVHLLRKKLKPHGITIETMYGVGWYLTKANQAALKDLMDQRP